MRRDLSVLEQIHPLFQLHESRGTKRASTWTPLFPASQLPAVFVRRWVELMNDTRPFYFQLNFQLSIHPDGVWMNGLKCYCPAWHWNAQTDGATQRSLMRNDFKLAWLWLSAASCTISSPSCCHYRKAELGIALAADFGLVTACWQTVLGNTELIYVLLCSVLLSTTSWFWFHYYQASTETLVWGEM